MSNSYCSQVNAFTQSSLKNASTWKKTVHRVPNLDLTANAQVYQTAQWLAPVEVTVELSKKQFFDASFHFILVKFVTLQNWVMNSTVHFSLVSVLEICGSDLFHILKGLYLSWDGDFPLWVIVKRVYSHICGPFSSRICLHDILYSADFLNSSLFSLCFNFLTQLSSPCLIICFP